MPRIQVRQLSTLVWQYRGNGAGSTWVDFATSSESPAQLTFSAYGALTFSADNTGGGCTDVQDAGTSSPISNPTTTYEAVAKCGAAGTPTTGYFTADTDDDIAP